MEGEGALKLIGVNWPKAVRLGRRPAFLSSPFSPLSVLSSSFFPFSRALPTLIVFSPFSVLPFPLSYLAAFSSPPAFLSPLVPLSSRISSPFPSRPRLHPPGV